MKVVGFYLVLLAVSCCFADLDQEWEDFKSKFGLKFKNQKLELLRKARFENAHNKVNEHNKKYDNGTSRAKMQMHPIALLTEEEFAQKLGFDPSAAIDAYQVTTKPTTTKTTTKTTAKPTTTKATTKTTTKLTTTKLTTTTKPTTTTATPVPASWDWRTISNVLSPVKDQKQCGSCWAFSSTGALESQMYLKYSKSVLLSEQQLVDCATAVIPSLAGCNGGFMNSAFDYVRINNGIDTESSYPYTAVGGTCMYNSSNVGATCTGYVNVATDVASIKKAVSQNGPLSIGIGVTSVSGTYSSGIFTDAMCTTLNHGVLLVGYGTDTNGVNYWIMKNSWGLNWGIAGYFLYPQTSATCTIAWPSYPLV